MAVSSASSEPTPPPPPPPLSRHPKPLLHVPEFLENLQIAAAWNHGKTGGKAHDKSLWDPAFCRQVVEQYDAYLQQLLQRPAVLSAGDSSSAAAAAQDLLAPDTVCWAFQTLTKSRYTPTALAQKVRDWEKALGVLQQTPLTDAVTLRLLQANGKAGNVGRCLSLLQLRLPFPPQRREFEAAIQSLQAAHWKGSHQQRNILVSQDALKLEDPSRWLDAILVHMHQRGFGLDVEMANRMLNCFAAGPTGRAVHHFYRIRRVAVGSELNAVNNDDDDDEFDDFDGVYVNEHMPRREDWDVEDEVLEWDDTDTKNRGKAIKVQLQYHPHTPPQYKVPSLSTPGQRDRERDPEFSYPLAAAFSFSESLQHGACGHAPIALNAASYTALIKACVHRGALHRAMELLPQQEKVAETDFDQHKRLQSFNLVLAGLARVGDVGKAQDLYARLLAANLTPDAWTVRAVLDGLLNLGDLSGAVTAVQDFFNQHGTLPPYTTHLKLLEFALASDQVYEAKRHVYFLQQLWHWKPNEYHSSDMKKLMAATQANPQLQKDALKQLFAYFGEELTEADFL